jgi:hypothetical protein
MLTPLTEEERLPKRTVSDYSEQNVLVILVKEIEMAVL